MPSKAEIAEQWPDSVLMFYDEYEAAIIGVAERINLGPVIAYDYKKCIEILVEQGMDHEEAVEYFNFNTIGAWNGELTPIFITT